MKQHLGVMRSEKSWCPATWIMHGCAKELCSYLTCPKRFVSARQKPIYCFICIFHRIQRRTRPPRQAVPCPRQNMSTTAGEGLEAAATEWAWENYTDNQSSFLIHPLMSSEINEMRHHTQDVSEVVMWSFSRFPNSCNSYRTNCPL